MIIPTSIATAFNLEVVLLPDPFSMHYPEQGASNTITHGVLRDKDYVWNYIAVSDRIDVLLIDIKQACLHLFSPSASLVAPELLLAIVQQQLQLSLC